MVVVGWLGFFLRRSECSGSEYIIGKLHPDKRSQSFLLHWLSLLQQYSGFTLYCSGEHIRGLMHMRMEGSGLWASFAGQCKVACRHVSQLAASVGCVEDNVSDIKTRWREARCHAESSLHYSHVLEREHLVSVVQLFFQLIHKLFKEGLARHTMLYKMGLWHLSGLAMYCWLPLFTALIPRS